MAFPRLYVAPAAVTAPRFGLLSVVQRPPATGRWEGGVEWQSDACSTTGYWPGPCSDTEPDPEEKVFPVGRPVLTADPFVVYGGFSCQLLGSEDALQVVERQFGYAEPLGLEQAFWEGAAGTPGLTLADNIDVLAPVGGLTAAVGALEKAIGQVYHGTPIIHAPRETAVYAAERSLAIRDGAVMRTPLDSLWAFGRGYDGAVGPDGEVTPDDSVWLYATGAVTLRQGEVMTSPPTLAAAVDRTTNMVTVVAERLNVFTVDCAIVAIPVVLAELETEEA